MNAKEIALQSYKEWRIKRRREIQERHQQGHYMDGIAIQQGKTKKKIHAESIERAKKVKDWKEKNAPHDPYAISPEQLKRFHENLRQQQLEAKAKKDSKLKYGNH